MNEFQTGMDYKQILTITLLFVTLVTSCPQIRLNANLCRCNGHSINCYVATSSSNCRNDSGNIPNLCIDCQNGTTGDQCQLCKSGYYRPVTEDLRSACTSKFCMKIHH